MCLHIFNECHSRIVRYLIILAESPTTMAPDGISLRMIAPAPMTAPSPMVTPGKIIAPRPYPYIVLNNNWQVDAGVSNRINPRAVQFSL